MARELKIRVSAEAGDAKRELTQVEQILQRNEQAAERAQSAIGGSSGTGGLVGAIGKLGPLMASLGILSAIKQTVEWGGHLADLSAKTGITAEGLQRLDLAGKLVGVSLDQMTTGVNQLQKRLAGGNDNANAALRDLHLNVQDLLKAAPDKMFTDIATALGNVPDPAERTRLAVALLGTTGATLLPVLVSDIRGVGQSAHVMANEAVEALDWFGDKLDTWAFNAKADLGNILASFLSVKGAVKELDIATTGGMFTKFVDDVERMNTIGVSVDSVGGAFDRTIPKVRSADDAMADLWATIGTPAEQLKKVEAQIKHNEAIQGLADTLTGKDVAKKVKDWSEALDAVERSGGLTSEATVTLGKNLEELVRKGATLPPKLSDIYRAYETTKFNAGVLSRTTKILTGDLDKQTRTVLTAVPAYITFNQKLEKMIELARMGAGPASLEAIGNLGTKITELPAPPVKPWQEFRDKAGLVMEDVERNVAGTVVSLIGHWSHWKSKSKEIWGEIKDGIDTILTDILTDFESRFIKGLISSITGAGPGFKGAFAGLLNGGSAAAAGAGAEGAGAAGSGGFFAAHGTTAGAAWGSAFAAAAFAYGIGWVISKYFGNGNGDKHESPDQRTGYNPDPASTNNPNPPGWDPGNPDTPTSGDGGMNTGPTGGLDPGYSGHGLPGFASGTRGRFIDFGAGTPVMLHRKERIMTEAEGRQERTDSVRESLDRTLGEWSEKFDRSLRLTLLEHRRHLQAVR